MREVYSLSRNRVKVVGPLTGEQEAAPRLIDKLMSSKQNHLTVLLSIRGIWLDEMDHRVG